MHIIPPYEPKVILTTWEGITRTFASRKVALNALGINYIRHRVHNRVDAELRWSTLVTEHGQCLSAADFRDLFAEENPLWHLSFALRRAHRTWNGEGPVPGTGVGRGGHCHRRPKTMNERRQNAFWDGEAGEPRARGARRPSMLPHSWDDLSIGSYGHRSWKRNRKTQWKEKKQKD